HDAGRGAGELKDLSYRLGPAARREGRRVEKQRHDLAHAFNRCRTILSARAARGARPAGRLAAVRRTLRCTARGLAGACGRPRKGGSWVETVPPSERRAAARPESPAESGD